MQTQYNRMIGVAPVFTVLVVTYFLLPTSLNFSAEGLKSLPAIFGYLVMISLFVERAIEVFLSAWRSGGADELDRKIEIISEKLNDILGLHDNTASAVATDEYKTFSSNLESIESERTQYRADSRFISQWLGLGIGVVLGLIGIRVLDNIVVSSGLTGYQQSIFILVDVLITGAVIAGGSESINKIMKLYNSFMDSTAKELLTGGHKHDYLGYCC